MSHRAASSLYASALRRHLSRGFVPMTELEPRRFLSITAASILGPQQQGDVFVYSLSTPGVATGTFTRTIAGTTLFNGAMTTESDNLVQIPNAAAIQTQAYYGFDSSGNYVFYGSAGNGITITNATPGILDPAVVVAGQTHSYSFTEHYSNGTTAVVTHTPKLLSETTTSLTVGAGTFPVYEIDDRVTTSTIAGSVLFQYFLSPGVGEVQLLQTVFSPALPSSGVTTTYELSSVSGPGFVLPSTNKLVFVQQPTDVAVGDTITPAVVVDVEDSSGNLLTDDNSTVTLQLSGNVSLGGTVSAVAVNGVATFSNISVPSGGNYTLIASDANLLGATSNSFTVSGGAVSNPLTLSVASSTLPSSVVAGTTLKGVKASVTLTNTGNVAQSGTATISLYASNDGTIDGSSTRLGSLTVSGGLKPSAHTTFTLPITSISSALSGNYTLFAQITGNTIRTATSAAGPMFTVAAPFTAFSESIVGVTGVTGTSISGQKTKGAIKLLITNNGNVQSSGNGTIAIYASPDDQASDGTLIRSIPSALVIKPSRSVPVSIPLLTLPNGLNGNYFFVVQATDSAGNVTSAASGSSYAIAAPRLSLVPTSAPLIVGKNGAGLLSLTITNEGNIPGNGNGTVTLVASSTGNLSSGTTVFTTPESLKIPVGRTQKVVLKLTAAEVVALQDATLAGVEVTDYLGVTQSLNLVV